MNSNGVGSAGVLDEKMGFEGSDFEGALNSEANTGAFRTGLDEDAGLGGSDDLYELRFHARNGKGFMQTFTGRIP